jgi:hypothetical protein
VVRIASGENNESVLEGFTITSGRAGLGAGVYIESSSPTIRNNWITKNSVPNGGNGAGMRVWYCSPVIDGNIISYNDCVGEGCGIDIEGGVSSPIVTNNVIFGNHAVGAGGGIELYDCNAILTNNTIVANTSDQSRGGGVSCQNYAWPTLVNCAVWGNVGQQIYVEYGGVTVDHCDVERGWAGAGNIDADPLFVDASGGDLHLGAGSPCINLGSNSAPNLPATDFEGDPRIIDSTVDIGADEAVLAPTVDAVVPDRTRYDQPVHTTVTGRNFARGSGTAVLFGGAPASNVVVVDDQTITCDAPTGSPGPADVTVSDTLGADTLVGGFTYTPAITILGTPQIGSSITIRYLCGPGDGLFAIYGAPPPVSVTTAPYDGTLCILPFHVLFYVPSWPFDQFDLNGTIPDEPSLSGVEVLLQALIGPSLTKAPWDASWTNCALLTIQ